jgi:hypothetical protein
MLKATKHNPPLTHADVKMIKTPPLTDDKDSERSESKAVKRSEKRRGID